MMIFHHKDVDKLLWAPIIPRKEQWSSSQSSLKLYSNFWSLNYVLESNEEVCSIDALIFE